jgi:hypothetical protein
MMAIRSLLIGRAFAAAVLFLFWVLMVASLRNKSLTYDEGVNVAAGYSYWHFNDYRLDPENGQLSQRLAGLPPALAARSLPDPDPVAWKNAEEWKLQKDWLYESGRDAIAWAIQGRALCGLFAVGLGALVWAWSRSLFGGLGGSLSLLLYVLSPTVLANGALMLSDMAVSCMFLASLWLIWRVMDEVRPGRLLLSSVVLGALLLTKVSALLVVPVAAVLVAVRIAGSRSLTVSIGGFRRTLTSRPARLAALLAAAAVHAAVAWAVIWACYGFRYSAFADRAPASGRFGSPWEFVLDRPSPARSLGGLGLSESQSAKTAALLYSIGATDPYWTNNMLDALGAIRREVLTPVQAAELDAELSRPSPVAWVRAVEVLRGRHVLPEAWLYGFAQVMSRSQYRPAFFEGDFRLRGWRTFFPYTFLVKTPLAVFGVILLALAALCFAPEGWKDARAALPLWVFLAVYWTAAVASHLNIGHRHILPVYAPMFVLCGAAAVWLESLLPGMRTEEDGGGRKPSLVPGWTLVGLIAWLGFDVGSFFPNYLAYFNGIIAPREAYRHLVDSSLDWGQDLPAVRAYLERVPPEEPTYFSYFGTASPDYYGIRAYPLFSKRGESWRRQADWITLRMPVGDAAREVPKLAAGWPDYDLLVAQGSPGEFTVILLKKPDRLGLGPGTYVISASNLQPVNFELDGPWGRWNARFEATYRQLAAEVAPLMSGDPSARNAALARRGSDEWADVLERFEEFRFARLTAHLRHREPDDEINFTALVYRISASELAQALKGPPAELGPDDDARELANLPEGISN